MVIFVVVVVLIILFLIFLMFLRLFSGNNLKLKEGIRLEASGKYYDALSTYDYLLQNGFSVPELRWKIANVCMKINNYTRALKELNVLQQTGQGPSNVSVYAINKLIAECYLRLNKEKEAFFSFVELLKFNPDDTWVLFELGKLYAGQAMTGKAIRLFEKCLKSNPNDPELNYYMARAFLDFGDSEKALQFFEKTARLRFFDHGKVNYYLGVIYFTQKKYNLALQHFPQVLKLRPNDNNLLSDSHHYIALSYKEKGLIDEAVINFEKSQVYSELLTEKNLNKKSLYNEGVLLLKNGQYDKALEKFYKVKMMDYKYKDVEKLIRIINTSKKNGEKMPDGLANFINENPLTTILRRGILYSKNRFNINLVERKAERYSNVISGEPAESNTMSKSTVYNILSVSNFNSMTSKQFKDLSRKLIRSIGFYIKSEPKFTGDDEYIDGNAINFHSYNIKNIKNKVDYLITVRRYKDMVPELSVSRFVEWMEEGNYKYGIFMASSAFSPQAFKVIHLYPNVKFIDRGGLSRILGRIS
ncbi:MAG: tetratricopeptide repeat protein [Spirochaetes bacterium]|nr:tetratricopeptide repeat protein [Spirochaetota bacterium]